jgi:hypothetical protein
LLLFLEDDDDLFLYEEAIIVAFGENETIEALIVILSLKYLFFLVLSNSSSSSVFTFSLSLLCFVVCLCGLLIWLSVVF